MMKCDPTVLWTLVEQSEEPGDEARGLLQHVERCQQCQATLRSIGGNESWWSDVQTWLADQNHRPAAAAEAGGISESTAMDLAVLQPPTHPEMLGRLGRYEIEGVVGRGGMGVVFRGFDSDLQRCVAIKILSPIYGHDAAARQRFAREAQAAASVVHEHVIPIFNVEAEHDPPFLVMPYIAGATLEQFVRRHGCPDAITVLRIARQIASGLHAAHQQDLIHRDIKPGNILVTENVHRVWITDFGLARAVDNATLTHTGLIAGTPQFMSPEQSRGQRLDARSDLFSFGALLYFLSTGRPPFEADGTLAVLHQVATTDPPSLAQARPDLPPAFVSLVNDLLRKRASRRPADAGVVSERISEAMAEFNSGATVQSTRRRQRTRRNIDMAAAAVVLISTAAAAYHWFPVADPQPVMPLSATSRADAAAPLPVVDRTLTEMVQKIDWELTQPDTDAAIERLGRQITSLERHSEFAPTVHADLLHEIVATDHLEIAALADAIERVAEGNTRLTWETISTGPAQPLSGEVLQLKQHLETLRTSFGAAP